MYMFDDANKGGVIGARASTARLCRPWPVAMVGLSIHHQITSPGLAPHVAVKTPDFPQWTDNCFPQYNPIPASGSTALFGCGH